MKRILHIATNIGHYTDPAHPTGLWLSELSHAWDAFATEGYAQDIASPAGGPVPLEPRALKWPLLDASARAWQNDPALMRLLRDSIPAESVDPHPL